MIKHNDDKGKYNSHENRFINIWAKKLDEWKIGIADRLEISAASDLGLHCLSRSQSGTLGIKWASSSENVSLGVCDQLRFKPACSATETS